MNPLRLALFSLLLLLPAASHSEPVRVRFVEGSVQGFLALRSMDGQVLASGNLTQVVHGSRVSMHLVFKFKDGSLDEETAVFTQRATFRLISDHHIQKGPSFPNPMDMLINTTTGMVTNRYLDKDKQKIDTAHMDLPPDLSNGVIFNLIKNIATDQPETKVSFLAATPKPRLVKLAITPLGPEDFSIAGVAHQATRFNVKIEIGGLTGLIAPLVGKEPPVMHVWVAAGAAPELVKLEGPLYLDGPIWRIEIASPVW